MITNLNSNIAFGRKEDISCVRQARTELNNIHQKFVRNHLLQEDTYGTVLILNNTRTGQGAESEVEIEVKGINKKRIDMASDKKISSMSLEEVQTLLNDAVLNLKTSLKECDKSLTKVKKYLSPIQKQLLAKIPNYLNSVLVTIPKK